MDLLGRGEKETLAEHAEDAGSNEDSLKQRLR